MEQGIFVSIEKFLITLKRNKGWLIGAVAVGIILCLLSVFFLSDKGMDFNNQKTKVTLAARFIDDRDTQPMYLWESDKAIQYLVSLDGVQGKIVKEYKGTVPEDNFFDSVKFARVGSSSMISMEFDGEGMEQEKITEAIVKILNQEMRAREMNISVKSMGDYASIAGDGQGGYSGMKLANIALLMLPIVIALFAIYLKMLYSRKIMVCGDAVRVMGCEPFMCFDKENNAVMEDYLQNRNNNTLFIVDDETKGGLAMECGCRTSTIDEYIKNHGYGAEEMKRILVVSSGMPMEAIENIIMSNKINNLAVEEWIYCTE